MHKNDMKEYLSKRDSRLNMPEKVDRDFIFHMPNSFDLHYSHGSNSFSIREGGINKKGVEYIKYHKIPSMVFASLDGDFLISRRYGPQTVRVGEFYRIGKAPNVL